MKTIVIVSCLFFVVIPLADSAQAGANPNATAWLSWDQDWENPVAGLDTMPAGYQHLYFQLGNLNEYGAVEFLVKWYPSGPWLSGCYQYAGWQGPAGAGDDCTWLVRSGGACVPEDHGDDYWEVICGYSECNTVCSSGNAARLVLDFNSCNGDTPGTFCILSLRITDCGAETDDPEVLGEATILGGVPPELHPCHPLAVTRCSWGVIKAMYR
jgi:hypothetical protein